MRFDILTVMPEMFSAVTEQGVTGRACRNGIATAKCWNPREFASDKHRTVDDRSYGGGPGMVMLYEPLAKTLDAIAEDVESSGKKAGPVLYLSPQGERWNQQLAAELGQFEQVTLLAGRYEGVDERLIESRVDREISIGDFVTSGGELPAMVMMDTMIRLLPGALGNIDSAEQDSFSDGLLDCPHYSRPEAVGEDGELKVPAVLMSGDHKKIQQWRLQQSLGRTSERRPDLLADRELNKQEQVLLREWQAAQGPAE